MLVKLYNALEVSSMGILMLASSIFILRRSPVSYHNSKHSYADIVCGLPQGSILGSLLFQSYINDMADVSTQHLSAWFPGYTNMIDINGDLEALIDRIDIEYV